MICHLQALENEEVRENVSGGVTRSKLDRLRLSHELEFANEGC